MPTKQEPTNDASKFPWAANSTGATPESSMRAAWALWVRPPSSLHVSSSLGKRLVGLLVSRAQFCALSGAPRGRLPRDSRLGGDQPGMSAERGKGKSQQGRCRCRNGVGDGVCVTDFRAGGSPWAVTLSPSMSPAQRGEGAGTEHWSLGLLSMLCQETSFT